MAYDYSSTQVNLPADLAESVRALGRSIPDADLADDGRETQPHCTIKYGLHTADAGDVRPHLEGEPPIHARFGRTAIFPASETGGAYDVVIVPVLSPDLHRLNKKLSGALPHTDTHPTYKPHVTVAYVTAGRGQHYAGRDVLGGRQATLQHVTFSSKDGQQTEIPLGHKRMSTIDELVRRFSGGGGRWITLHSEDGEEGTVHVFIGSGGKITKGPAALLGANIGHLASHPSVKRAEHHAEGHVPAGATAHPSYAEKTPGKGKPYARTESSDTGLSKEQAHAGLARAQSEAKAAATTATAPATARGLHDAHHRATVAHLGAGGSFDRTGNPRGGTEASRRLVRSSLEAWREDSRQAALKENAASLQALRDKAAAIPTAPPGDTALKPTDKTEGGIQPERAKAQGQHDLFGGTHALPDKKDTRTEAQKQAQAGQQSMFKPTLDGGLEATPNAKAPDEDPDERQQRLDDERASLEQHLGSLKAVRDFIRDQGGIAPYRNQTAGQERGGISTRKADEYRYLPNWSKGSNGNGAPADRMAQHVAEAFPHLGIETDDDLHTYLKDHDAERQDGEERLSQLKAQGAKAARGGGGRKGTFKPFKYSPEAEAAHAQYVKDFVPLFEGDVGFSEDDMDDETTAEQPRQADDPGMSDVHMPGPMGGSGGGGGKRKNHAWSRLVERVRSRFTDGAAISSDMFEEDVRHALGHAGGKGKAEKRSAQASDDKPTDELAGLEPDMVDGQADVSWVRDADADDEPEPTKRTKARSYSEGSAHVNTADADFRMFLPVQCAEAPDWIPYLPKPGTFQHPRYGKIAITPERNADFVQKFHAGVYQTQIPLDGEHQTKLSGAMAWVREMRQNGDGSVDARVEWTNRGRDMLADNRFKFISPEWFDEWSDPATGHKHTNVVIGGALTTRPYFKESALRPLVASEAGIYVPDEDQEPVPACRAGEQHNSPTGPEDTTMPAETTSTQLTEEQARQFAEMETRLATLEQERTAAIQASEQAATEARQAAERVAALETAARRRQFAEQAQDWGGDSDGHVAFMESLTDEQRSFYVTQQNAHAEQTRQSRLFSSIGVRGSEAGEGTALGKAQGLATSLRQSDPKLSEAQAMDRVFSENPDLYAQYEAGN